MNENLLKAEEKVVFHLRDIYQKYGYASYQMSKFEEYELYVRHKEFLAADRVITFNDTNGKLLALKPDVTLSIIKSGEDIPGVKQKVYYNENVYRVGSSTHRFQEIMQAGLECIGDIDLYDMYEVICLAAESLAAINPDFVLCVSQLDLLQSVLDRVSPDEAFRREAMQYLSQKNTHDLKKLCSRCGITDADYQLLSALVHTYGSREKVLRQLQGMDGLCGLDTLYQLSALLDNSVWSRQIQFDFSLVSDTNYYNGFVFRGFLDGISSHVLSGGQYDNMMKKMNRTSGAIGFAVYLDLLDQLDFARAEYDVDFLLLYDSSCSMQKVADKVSDLLRKGFTCSAQKAVPQKLRYKEVIDFRKEGAEC